MSPDLLRPLQSVLNRHIAGSGRARRLLAQLAGRALELRVTATPLRLFLVAESGRIEIRPDNDRPADAVIEGTPLVFARLAFGDAAQSIRGGGAQLAGDAEIAQGFRDLLAAAQPDFEEELSRLTGDVAAHHLANLARGMRDFMRRARDSLEQNVAEYLTEESRDLPTRGEVEEFLEGVDRLREAADRFAARLAALERGRAGP